MRLSCLTYSSQTHQLRLLLACVQLPVQAMAFSPDGRHALSASEGERSIAVWHLEGPTTKKSQPSCGLLSLEDPAAQIASSAAQSTAPADAFQVVHGLSVHPKRGWLSRSLHVPLIELLQIPVVGVISLQAKQR